MSGLRATLRRVAVALAVAGLICLPATASAGPAAAQSAEEESTTWTIQPATADGPDGRLSLRHVLDPGTSTTDWVSVTNFGPRAATFRVYAGAGAIGETGAFDIRGPGDDDVSITFAETDDAELSSDGALTVALEPEESLAVPMTIAVPDSAVPGDHPAGVVAELVPEAGSDVQLRSRVGVRAHLRVTGELTARVAAEDVRAQWSPGWNPFSPGTLHVEYTLHNTGNVRLGTTSTVEVSGPFGLLPATAEDSRREVLPGERVAVQAAVPLWGLVRATGDVTVAVNTVGEDQVDAALESARTGFHAWTIPWVQLLIVALVLLGSRARKRYRLAREQRVQRQIDDAVAAARDSADEDMGVVSRG